MDACNSHHLMSFSFLIITTFHPDIDRFYTKSYFCSSLDETEWIPFFEMTWMENEISVAKIFTYCSHLLWTPSGIEYSYIMASVEYFIRSFACKSCRQSSRTLTLPRRFNDSSKWQGKWPRLSFMLTAVQEHSKLSLMDMNGKDYCLDCRCFQRIRSNIWLIKMYRSVYLRNLLLTQNFLELLRSFTYSIEIRREELTSH